MTAPPTTGLAENPASDGATLLRIRIFQLTCGLTAVLCLLVVAPLNALQNLPWGVHLGNVVLGLAGAICYWRSRRGRHHFALFLFVLVVLLDVIWFLNAGSDGSVTHYFYPVMLFVITLFTGWTRWVLAVGVWVNVGLLFVLEQRFPHWVTPFQNRLDRLVDLETGILCSFLALGSVSWFILASYNREQRRVRETAARLVASEANYREIFNSTSDGLMVHGADGRILDVNEQACALFGTDRAGLIGRAVEDVSLGQSPYSAQEAHAKLQRALRGEPQLIEWRSKRASGELFWSEVALRAWQGGEGDRVVAAIRDISGRKDAQEALRLNEERLRLAMEASHQGWFEVNVPTGETISSTEYVRMLGYEPAEFQSSLAAWIERLHPADRDAALQGYRGGMQTGKIESIEYRQKTKAGGWKWFRSVAKVVERDPAGQPVRVMGTHTDITERKELEAQLLHSQRLEAVGTLASGVAHDLNNILTPMLMASGILRDKLADARDRELMGLLDDGGRRGAAIVRQLLAFSRNLAQERVPLDPRQLLRDMAQLMRATLPKGISIVEQAGETAGLIEAEPNQLHQVLMNLCVNARDAISAGGTITLGLERADVSGVAGAKDGPHVVLSVADTGHGIPPEIMERIFDPFFTTKPLGKGTGLGLATVHGIVKDHHGFVRVASQPGQGTTFRVFLPVWSGLPGSSPAATPSIQAVTPTGAHVLIVDDDPAVRLVTGRLLERMGHPVLTATGGAQALEMLKQHRAEVALVITDFSMPEMDGPTLVPRLLALSPGVRIIGVSGLDQRYRLAELARLGFSEVLSKPYEMSDLMAAVKRQLTPTETTPGVDPAR
ncbi:Wide host range VirA protein [Lacunisphaera limnophila]|uniref:histidine kinase n=1 Tax=Lacunisphaera limnophila TaxID=1838286 RepID=A0A1D8AZ56_9BACT|nr:PAS domain S-box protein [Lacunisphaera limnophila]AOS46178.1 Wide host range VirA protein [Lacunisphaera limnophila]